MEVNAVLISLQELVFRVPMNCTGFKGGEQGGVTGKSFSRNLFIVFCLV